MKKLLLLVLLMLSISFAFISCNNDEKEPSDNNIGDVTDDTTDDTSTDTDQEKYDRAMAYIEAREYQSAYDLLKELGDFSDAKTHLNRFKYVYFRTFLRGEGSDEVEYLYEIKFNDKNLPSEYINYDGINQVYRFTYDEFGNVTICECINGESVTTWEYTYDTSGNLIKEVKKSDESEVKITYTYNSDGALIEMNTDSHTETILGSFDSSRKVVYTYDENGRLIEEFEEKNTTTTYTYDEKGNLLKKVISGGSVKSVYEYKYDENGKTIESSFTNIYNEKATSFYDYDSRGNLIKHYNALGNIYEEYFYDEFNRVIGLVMYFDESTVEEYRYTYDSNGQLISADIFINGAESGSMGTDYVLVYIPYDEYFIRGNDLVNDIFHEGLI